MHASSFNESNILHHLKHDLPTQTPLKDFIHHNSLHAFQDLKFFDAIFKASKIFGYQVTLELNDYRRLALINRIKMVTIERLIHQQKGNDTVEGWKNKMLIDQYGEHNEARIGKLRQYWKSALQIDLDTLVQPLLFRVVCAYLDQGISLWNFPLHPLGFLASLREIEEQAFTSFFKTKKVRNLFLSNDFSLHSLLTQLVGDEAYFDYYLYDQQFTHRGWSGMIATVEERPDTLLACKKISLKEFICFELLLELDALEHAVKNRWKPIASYLTAPLPDPFAEVDSSELNEVLKLWQQAFEWSYYDEVLNGLAGADKSKHSPEQSVKSFQAVFCIDERECSLRRNIESQDPTCETLGSPGFFGVEFFYQAQGAKFYDKLCPAPVTPKYLIKESGPSVSRAHELLYTPKTQPLLSGMLSSFTLGFASAVQLTRHIFRPKMSPAISNAFSLMHQHGSLSIENSDPGLRENDLQIGFSVDEMSSRVEALLRSIGLIDQFAPIVYLVAHGSSSANNPHHGAHDCGACSGRPGGVNARVFAFMANHIEVRKRLKANGIHIPDTTQFIGSLHDTAADQIEYYIESDLPASHLTAHKQHQITFDQALNKNARERSRRFKSIGSSGTLNKIRKAIKDRSVSLFEPRPELGHGTNSLCIVGPRSLTKNLFLDRRAFLNSYNYRTDPEGILLTNVMKPLGPVCGGINLEYYFSRMDNHKLGAGTKLPHHVMGLIGVTNSCDGDLRPGLPLQMIEVHDPVRLLILVEHYPEVILKCIQSSPEMYEWFINEWVHLVSIHPDDHSYYYFKEGAFNPYKPCGEPVSKIKSFDEILDESNEMETNYIVDATQENLPVCLLP